MTDEVHAGHPCNRDSRVIAIVVGLGGASYGFVTGDDETTLLSLLTGLATLFISRWALRRRGAERWAALVGLAWGLATAGQGILTHDAGAIPFSATAGLITYGALTVVRRDKVRSLFTSRRPTHSTDKAPISC